MRENNKKGVDEGELHFPKESFKLFSKTVFQCQECNEIFTRNRVHKCKTGINQYRWPKLGRSFICLLCLTIRRTKEKLAIHYLYHHSITDIEILGLSPKHLYFAVRPEEIGLEMEVRMIINPEGIHNPNPNPDPNNHPHPDANDSMMVNALISASASVQNVFDEIVPSTMKEKRRTKNIQKSQKYLNSL